MASLNTLNDYQVQPSQPLRTVYDIENYWKSTIMEEPISDSLKESVRADLMKAWHFRRVQQFFIDTKIRWATTDFDRIVLEDTIGELEPKILNYLCNKPTALYWLQSAQSIDAFGQRCLTPGIIFATIYETWFRCQHAEPDIEFEHFFANPVRISSTGPSTIQAVIEAHRSLCNRASRLIDEAKGEAENTIKRFPLASQHHRLSLLYHAIVVLLDRLDRPDKGQELESDGLVSLRLVAQRQTVLLARTGAEEGLTAPISFTSLRSQSYPLERSDVATNSVDVIRVSLAAAVKFIADLETRENLASAETKDHHHRDTYLDPHPPEGYEDKGQVCRDPETWTEAVIDAAEKHGYDNIPETWQSIRRVQANSVGQEFCQFEHQPLGNRWRY